MNTRTQAEAAAAKFEINAAIEETLNLLDIALLEKNAILFVECELPISRIEADVFEAIEPR